MMTRIDYRAWFCAPLFALVLAYVGCTAGSTGTAPPEAPKTKKPGEAAALAPAPSRRPAPGRTPMTCSTL